MNLSGSVPLVLLLGSKDAAACIGIGSPSLGEDEPTIDVGWLGGSLPSVMTPLGRMIVHLMKGTKKSQWQSTSIPCRSSYQSTFLQHLDDLLLGCPNQGIIEKGLRKPLTRRGSEHFFISGRCSYRSITSPFLLRFFHEDILFSPSEKIIVICKRFLHQGHEEFPL